MKIMFLNLAFAEVEKPLEKYLKDKAGEIDVFCLQEAYDEVEAKLEKWLLSFNSCRNEKKITEISRYTQKTFFKKEIDVLESADLMKNSSDTGLALHTKIKYENMIFNVCNVHGIAYPGDKLDNPGRLKQSQVIIDFYKNAKEPVIIGGDFNLELKTQSVNMFKDYGYTNLIEEYEIRTTRNHLAWDLFPDNPQYYADHVFVSSKISVKDFKVENIEVSDHLPMVLEI